MKLDQKRIKNYFSGKGSAEDGLYIERLFCNEEMQDELKELLEEQWAEILDNNNNNLPEKDLSHIIQRFHDICQKGDCFLFCKCIFEITTK